MRAFSTLKVPAPPDLRELTIDKTRPLDVEIGCGVGFHPIRYANENPERQLIAIERTSEKFEKFAGRLKNHPVLPNLTAIHGDAIAWISHALEMESVDRFVILYPNPYPKPGQKNLRFHYMPFTAHLKETMKPGGELWIASNSASYIDEALRAYVEDWGLELVEHERVLPDARPRTHFEKKYLARGEPCWSLKFRKTLSFLAV